MELYHFYRFPRSYAVSHVTRDIQSYTSDLLCHAGYYETLNQSLWQKAVAYMYLDRHERKVFKGLFSQNNSAGKWLAVRMAAKDAVRLHLNTTRHLSVLPADIHIHELKDGRFAATCPRIGNTTQRLMLSISLNDTAATARLIEQTEPYMKETIKHA
jgi:phosphopantetheinyl transferase (holo-ACP synthase)